MRLLRGNMRKNVRILLNIFLLAFPWPIRRPVMNLLFSYDIRKGARIGMSIVLCDRLIMEEGSFISHLTFINNIDLCHMRSYAKIGRNNWITGLNSKSNINFTYTKGRKCELIVGESSRITPKHFIDCSGGVYIGKFTTVAGLGTQILSHSIDIDVSRQSTGPVTIGKYCFVGTACIFLKNSSLPDYSVLGAGSVLNKAYSEDLCLYGGVPARKIKKFNYEENLYFKRTEGSVS